MTTLESTTMEELQIEKLKLFEWLAQLNDPESLKKVIALKQEIDLSDYEEVFPKMTVEQLHKNIAKSEADIKAGRFTDIESVELENWD